MEVDNMLFEMGIEIKKMDITKYLISKIQKIDASIYNDTLVVQDDSGVIGFEIIFYYNNNNNNVVNLEFKDEKFFHDFDDAEINYDLNKVVNEIIYQL